MGYRVEGSGAQGWSLSRGWGKVTWLHLEGQPKSQAGRLRVELGGWGAQSGEAAQARRSGRGSCRGRRRSGQPLPDQAQTVLSPEAGDHESGARGEGPAECQDRQTAQHLTPSGRLLSEMALSAKHPEALS